MAKNPAVAKQTMGKLFANEMLQHNLSLSNVDGYVIATIAGGKQEASQMFGHPVAAELNMANVQKDMINPYRI
jgi:hypothetical protein